LPSFPPQVTGGRNGYGAKLANIFSTEFTVETCDGTRCKRYKQVFRSNMSVKDKPKVRARARATRECRRRGQGGHWQRGKRGGLARTQVFKNTMSVKDKPKVRAGVVEAR
jgi:hypothetical protein